MFLSAVVLLQILSGSLVKNLLIGIVDLYRIPLFMNQSTRFLFYRKVFLAQY